MAWQPSKLPTDIPEESDNEMQARITATKASLEADIDDHEGPLITKWQAGQLWSGASALASALTFAIEFTIFTMFIHLEAQKLLNRVLLNDISYSAVPEALVDSYSNAQFTMDYYMGFFISYGILCTYCTNAYSAYAYSCYMMIEWTNIYLGLGHMEYDIPKIGMTLPAFQ